MSDTNTSGSAPVKKNITRRDVLAALAPERIDLPRFVARWTHPDTQAGLRAVLARAGDSASSGFDSSSDTGGWGGVSVKTPGRC